MSNILYFVTTPGNNYAAGLKCTKDEFGCFRLSYKGDTQIRVNNVLFYNGIPEQYRQCTNGLHIT